VVITDTGADLRNSDHFESHPILKENVMKNLQVYDKPMCCSTGVCGPQVDPVLPRFAADLDWLKSQGNEVERFNLAQQPMALLKTKGCTNFWEAKEQIVCR